MADIGNELGIVIQDITHGIERIARRRVQRRLIDQMLCGTGRGSGLHIIGPMLRAARSRRIVRAALNIRPSIMRSLKYFQAAKDPRKTPEIALPGFPCFLASESQ